MPLDADAEAEALVRLYVADAGDVARASLALARDLIDALDELAAMRTAAAAADRAASAGFRRRRLARP
jgi:hypothetical protein